MAAIVKANANLTNGGLSVIRRSFTTTDDGTMRYEVDYVCLATYASKWTPFFKTKAQPPTQLPASMLQLQLTKTPELFDLQTETLNGLTYFKAVYSAGIATEVIITEESDVRTFTVTTTVDVGTNVTVPGTINGATSFVSFGTETTTQTYEYISITVTAEAKNADLPEVRGWVIPIDGAPTASATTITLTSKRRTSRGEYTYRKSSSGVIKDIVSTGGTRTLN